jgi:hypothetical protein
MFLPMTTSRLRTMRMVLTTLPIDLNERYDTTAREAVFASTDKGTPVDDMIFLDGDHLTHVSMVYSNNTGKSKTHGKLVARPIDQSLSVYMFFFFKYCKGNWNTQINRKHTVENTHLFFTQLLGGEWKYLMRHVQTYSLKLGLPVSEMGLMQKTSSYMHQSRVAWVASRASVIDTRRIAADSRAVKMGFAQDHKFYTGLQSLRDTQRARRQLGGSDPDAMTGVSTPTLNPVVEELYPLLMELQSKEGTNPMFLETVQTFMPDYEWQAVDGNDALYSRELKSCIGGRTGKSVKTYLAEERKKDQRKGIFSDRARTRSMTKVSTGHGIGK